MFVSSIGLDRRSELVLSREPWPCVQSPPSLGTKRTSVRQSSQEVWKRNPGTQADCLPRTLQETELAVKFQHLEKLIETYPQPGAPAHQHTQPKFTGAMVTPCDHG